MGVIEEGITIQYDRVGGRGGISKPTERKALQFGDSINASKWVRVVDKTLEHFAETGKDTLIKLKYFEKFGEIKIMRKLYIERRETLYDWINDILTYASMLAIQFGLLKVVSEDNNGNLEN